MTWTCRNCGKVMLSEEEYKRHVCQGKIMSTCPRCLGQGKIIQAIGPAIDCPTCNGKGKV